MPSLNYAVPSAEVPFVHEDGRVSSTWYLFLSAVFQTIGGPSVVPGGSGISPSDNAQQFEEYAVTSIEAVEALRGVDELRNSRDTQQDPQIHQLLNIVDELRNELSSSRGEVSQLRNRLELIEDRLA